MKLPLALLLALLTGGAQAYTAGELQQDCLAAEVMLGPQKSSAPYDALRGTRCISYLAGFVDGYAIADYLASRVDLRLGGICIPKEEDITPRMVRAIIAQFERMPAKVSQGTAEITAAALARHFPCNDSPLEKKQ